MRMSKVAAVAALLVLAGTGCKDEGETLEPGENTRIEITSDPDGASIELNDVATGRTTPSTIFDIIGRQRILVRLDRDGIGYGYRTEVDVRGDSLHRVTGPLMFRCSGTNCLLASSRNRDLGRLRISTQANGALFMRAGNGEGLLWPLGSSNSYSSAGLPLIAMLSATGDTLALGIYDIHYLAGRPAPTVEVAGDRTTLRQSTWIVPTANVIINNMPTVRGIEVEEELIGNANSDVVFIRLTYRNITDRESYRAADPVVPAGGLTFNEVFMGFALDIDVGRGEDDMVTYEPALETVYIYDSNFQEDIFNAAFAASPGIIGMKIVDAPSTATVRVLNAWPRVFGVGSGDWSAGTQTERGGFSMLSGLRSLEPDHPGRLVGHVPTVASDYRMSVSAGPVSLAPGDAASITVAVMMASPVSGEFNSGQTVAPGNPNDDTRQIRRVAAALLDRARTVVAP